MLGVLHYIQARLMDPATLTACLKSRQFASDQSTVGSFLNLTCGHNNSFSQDEQHKLEGIIKLALQTPSSGIV